METSQKSCARRKLKLRDRIRNRLSDIYLSLRYADDWHDFKREIVYHILAGFGEGSRLGYLSELYCCCDVSLWRAWIWSKEQK